MAETGRLYEISGQPDINEMDFVEASPNSWLIR
jgi:hypothetical protein